MTHRWERHPVVEGIKLLSYHEDGKPVRWFLHVQSDDAAADIELDEATAQALAEKLGMVKA